MSGGSDSPPPDPNIGLAEKQTAGIAQQQLDFAQKAYANDQPRLQRYADLADQYVQSQVASQKQQSDLANAYQQRLQGTFQPIQDTLAFDSLGYYDASPQVKAKLEAAYTAKNTQGINDRYAAQQGTLQNQYDTDLANHNAQLAQRKSAIGGNTSEAQLSSLNAQRDTTTQQLNAINAANAQRASDDSGFSLGDGLTAVATGGISTAVGALSGDSNNGQSTSALQAQIDNYNKQADDIRQKQKTQGYTNDANAAGDAQYAIDPSTGKTYAAGKLAAQQGALDTSKNRELGNVGSSLDTVRAYADAYQSGQENLAGQARQDVANQFDQRNAQTQRQLASVGVDATSGRFAQGINQNNVIQAASEGQAMNQARQQAKQLGWAKRMDASGLGNGLPGNQATSTGLAQQAGQGGLAGQSSVIGAYQNSNNNFMQGLGQAGSSFGQLGQLGLANNQQAQQAYQNNQTNNGALTGALVGAAGTLGGAYLSGGTSLAAKA